MYIVRHFLWGSVTLGSPVTRYCGPNVMLARIMSLLVGCGSTWVTSASVDRPLRNKMLDNLSDGLEVSPDKQLGIFWSHAFYILGFWHTKFSLTLWFFELWSFTDSPFLYKVKRRIVFGRRDWVSLATIFDAIFGFSHFSLQICHLSMRYCNNLFSICSLLRFFFFCMIPILK